jgi:signal transduction histidine kinase
MGHGTVAAGRTQSIFIRKEFHGPLAALAIILVLFSFLAAYGQTSRNAEAALDTTHRQLQDFLLTWYAWRADRGEGGADPGLWDQCRRDVSVIVASPVWGPMTTLKRLPPGALNEFQERWDALPQGTAALEPLEAATRVLLTNLDEFTFRQRAVDGILEQLIWATTGFILVVSGFLVWNQVRQREVSLQLQGLHRASLVALEEERKSLSRDLHDTVAQDLAAVKLQLSQVALPSETGERVRTALDSALSQVRLLAVGLRPPSLDRIGLAASLQELCEATARQGPMGVTCDVSSGLGVLNEATTLHLYRIVQEALQNAVRHSHARSIRVTLRRLPDKLVVEIVDDGLGWEGAPPRSGRPSLGLIGMRERAGLIGGQWHVESSPGSGTRIHLEVPHEDSDR